jgi:hypothetical protein
VERPPGFQQNPAGIFLHEQGGHPVLADACVIQLLFHAAGGPAQLLCPGLHLVHEGMYPFDPAGPILHPKGNFGLDFLPSSTRLVG